MTCASPRSRPPPTTRRSGCSRRWSGPGSIRRRSISWCTAPPPPPTRCWNASSRPPGLITTRGFRDVLELGRRTRPRPYGLTGWFEPLIPRELRLEVSERMDAEGRVVVPLDEDGGGGGGTGADRTGVRVGGDPLPPRLSQPGARAPGPATSWRRSGPTTTSPPATRSSPSSASTSAAPPPRSTPACSRSSRATSRASSRSSRPARTGATSW